MQEGFSLESPALIDDAPTESARRQKTRARLLDAAFEIFAEKGVHAASVEMITEAAGFTRGAFYSNFSTKEELFFALMERENALRIEQLQVGVAEYLGPFAEQGVGISDEVVGTVIAKVLELQSDDRRWCLVQSEFMLLAMRDADVASWYLDFQNRFFVELTAIVVGALDSVSRRFVIDPLEAVRIIAELCERAAQNAILAGDPRPLSDRVSESLRTVVLALTEKI
ncbi:TetR/AcrR family transcriptional regulator [Diaminobutyricibacter tongyongensis]|uniref:TetR/AcrR family transcriptional regulator n=1 Tax=Leifsonia tongyongensis TaxID=1268043 RepID=A0A6L9XZA2_9MICO|nr:TetR/AcrR family transcriptional regulator [Diaminobutyricibacter tongyongensis]